MHTQYLIYFGEKPYYITGHLSPALYALTYKANTIIVNHPTDIHIIQTMKDLDHGPAEVVIILTSQVEHYWKVFQQQFKTITAGGGVIKNENNEVLFIFRRGKWDLPKGKLDDGESIEACAVREVREETGLAEVSITDFMGNTFHTYHEKGKFILKTTVWFRMQAPGNQRLTPQTEEDISAMAWLPADRWNEVLSNTFPAIKALLEQLPA
jgi:8-oxo-dGTP pyrophosphatase MutT (NUDIX family)